jgi:MYXO-CTERM domain-containing protein
MLKRNRSAQKNRALKSSTACAAALLVLELFAILQSASAAESSGTVILNGGTLNTAGVSEHNPTVATVTRGIGAVTLLSGPTIDFAAGVSILAFGGSRVQSWSGTLVIGHETDATGLDADQLGKTSFHSDSGATSFGSGGFATSVDGETVSVTEPSTWFAAALAFGALGFAQRRRMRNRRATESKNERAVDSIAPAGPVVLELRTSLRC